MAGYQCCISLALVCLLLCHDSLGVNNQPCKRSKNNNAYNRFLQKHIPPGQPAGLNQNDWQTFIQNANLPRFTQSFLRTADTARVLAVCSNKGGKEYRGNLCISRDLFTFTTVRCDDTACNVRSVISETKHLILGCDLLKQGCRPTHFEGNKRSEKPGNNKRGCRGGPP